MSKKYNNRFKHKETMGQVNLAWYLKHHVLFF